MIAPEGATVIPLNPKGLKAAKKKKVKGKALGGSLDPSGLLDYDRLLLQPPAVTDVLAGQMPRKDLQFKGPLFTPMQLGAMTPDEQLSLQTALAGRNESLQDYQTAQQDRFGGTGARRPRLMFVA